MSECLPDFPRYIRCSPTKEWQMEGADHPDGPWRPIPAPQSGLPWPTVETDGPAVQSREPASVVEEPSDEELWELFDWLKDEWRSNSESEFPLSLFARAVLARWAHQPTFSADDIPRRRCIRQRGAKGQGFGPFSEHELREQWNQHADEFNLGIKWDSLDSYEQLAWAQDRAIQRDRNARPTSPSEGEVAELVDSLLSEAGCEDVEHRCATITAPELRRAAELLQQQEVELQECRQVSAAFEKFNQQRGAND